MNGDVLTKRRSRNRAGESGRYAISPEKLFLSGAGSWHASWQAHEQAQWRRILGWQTPAPKEEEQPPPRRLPVRKDMTTAFVEEVCRALVGTEEPQNSLGFVGQLASSLQGHLRRYVSPTPIDAGLKRKFNSLVAQWKPAVETMSSATSMVLHPSYQSIIALGPRVVPLVLRELDRELHHWFWALRILTGENPVPDRYRGNMAAMREAWLAWGRSKGYRW